MKKVFLLGTMMEKIISHFFQIHLCLVKYIVWSKTGPMSGKWLESWNDFLKNDGYIMFMSLEWPNTYWYDIHYASSAQMSMIP